MNPFPESLDRMSEIVFVIVFWLDKLLVVYIYIQLSSSKIIVLASKIKKATLRDIPPPQKLLRTRRWDMMMSALISCVGGHRVWKSRESRLEIWSGRQIVNFFRDSRRPNVLLLLPEEHNVLDYKSHRNLFILALTLISASHERQFQFNCAYNRCALFDILLLNLMYRKVVKSRSCEQVFLKGNEWYQI